MNLDILNQYKKSHDDIHLSVGRTKHFVDTESDWKKETDQINLFLDTLNNLNTNEPVMIELGTSDIPIYTKIFSDIFPNGKNVCTEILLENYAKAKSIVPEAKWYHCYNGAQRHLQEKFPTAQQTGNAKLLTLESLFKIEVLNTIDILHMDIQGAECDVLDELNNTGLHLKIKNIFVSIHGAQAYNHCKSILDSWNANYKFSHPTQGAFGDGLIVATL